jgi:outer membrane PBP1 activator LpoA protein
MLDESGGKPHHSAMTTAPIDKLSKVLALSDSSQDWEALAALRAARTMLKSDGVDLSSVLQDALAQRDISRIGGKGSIVAALQRDILQLQAQLRSAQQQLREQQQETRYWRARADATGARKT